MKQYRIAPGIANEIEKCLLLCKGNNSEASGFTFPRENETVFQGNNASKTTAELRDFNLVFGTSTPAEYRRLLQKHSSVFGVIPDSGITPETGAFSDYPTAEINDSFSDSQTAEEEDFEAFEFSSSSWPQGVYLMEESAEEEIDDDYLRLVRARCLEIPYVTAVGERIFLREFWEEDLPEMTWLKGTFDERREQIASYRNHVYLPWSIGIWGIFRLSDRKLLGRAGLEYDRDGEVTLGYEVLKPFRRQGYALEAVLLALDTFRKMDPDYAGIRPIVVNISPENEPSVSLIKKAEQKSPLPLEIRLVSKD